MVCPIELKCLSLASPLSNSLEKACSGLTLSLIGTLSVMKNSFYGIDTCSQNFKTLFRHLWFWVKLSLSICLWQASSLEKACLGQTLKLIGTLSVMKNSFLNGIDTCSKNFTTLFLHQWWWVELSLSVCLWQAFSLEKACSGLTLSLIGTLSVMKNRFLNGLDTWKSVFSARFCISSSSETSSGWLQKKNWVKDTKSFLCLALEKLFYKRN